jgi:hypothetical protein
VLHRFFFFVLVLLYALLFCFLLCCTLIDVPWSCLAAHSPRHDGCVLTHRGMTGVCCNFATLSLPYLSVFFFILLFVSLLAVQGFFF